MSKPIDLQAVREMLEGEKSRLLEAMAEHGGAADGGRNPDRSALAQVYATRERDAAFLAMERQQLEQVLSAIERVEEGTYGQCVDCGEQISPERLEILPYATLCVRCQAKRE